MHRTFLHDIIDFTALATQSLEKEDFTVCFEPISPLEMERSGILYIFSFPIRYFILFPFRLIILLISSSVFIPLYSFYVFFNISTERLFKLYCKSFLWSFGAKIHHHGKKRRINTPHIYVANHTSFVDYIVLSSYKFCHACVSENHGGLFGFLFNTILRQNGSIAFKRSEKHDRKLVLERIKKHVHDTAKTPMLMFPEGTCVNNKYTVLFQKGAFELGHDVVVFPVAIKFRRNLMDPYWNRRKHTFTEHLFYLMTRWRLEADVWWLDGMKKRVGEDPSCFAMRVKEVISERGGLKSVLWNGYFKSSPVLRDREILREAYRDVFRNKIKVIRPFSKHRLGEHRFKRLIIENNNEIVADNKIQEDITNKNENLKNETSSNNKSDSLAKNANVKDENVITSNNGITAKENKVETINNNSCEINDNKWDAFNHKITNECQKPLQNNLESYKKEENKYMKYFNASSSSINKINAIQINEKNQNIQKSCKINSSTTENSFSYTRRRENTHITKETKPESAKTSKRNGRNYKIRKYKHPINNKKDLMKNIPEVVSDKKEEDAEKVYFGEYKYNEYINLVLESYLKLKNAGLHEINLTEGVWWGYIRGLKLRRKPCKCSTLNKRKIFCQNGSCRSEMFFKK